MTIATFLCHVPSTDSTVPKVHCCKQQLLVSAPQAREAQSLPLTRQEMTRPLAEGEESKHAQNNVIFLHGLPVLLAVGSIASPGTAPVREV